MNTLVSESLLQQVLSSFQEKVAGPAFLSAIRQQAFDRFSAVGFPTVKDEEWKYTNIYKLIDQSYVLNSDVDIDGLDFSAGEIPNLDAHRIVLVNGQYMLSFASLDDEKGLIVKTMEDAVEEPAFQAHFAQYADKTDNPFVALNTSGYTNGVFIALAKNTILSKPIQIIHVATGQEDFFSQTRNLIVVEANAEVEIIETYMTVEGSAKNIQNKVSEIVVKENAKVQHYYLQIAEPASNYFNHTEVYQEKYSLYNNYNCNFPGASFIRNNINVRLDAENVESHLYGINLTGGKQLVDNHTVVDHLKPHCESYEWYKNITQDESIAVFNGKIFVREDAQKTNAFQQNNNMLISDKSAVYTKPQLEIFADDVKCSHGCTIGQFDNDALFYLRARGIGEESARILLVHAFAFDVTNRFSNETVRTYVEELASESLKSK
ncbi:Fe-S cluster assembly protein SufD [Sphingobacterium sp. SRCM116780]|uniref:Fe-S cluster assembly protein SufD n=1 Tax=Sphingobacterium sp. SRCM116780 TaxID=2907623 RepID=UPI001F41434C|nr:Fe-S cluster assembly protein SufD [Sphingobacterium sp. SRCM116780]UIR56053.1 Fe-S cluster assembly protein SufD [Sphingobacterium sp. SRCM116780]